MNTTEVKTTGLIKSFSDLYDKAKEQFLMYEKLEGISDWKSYDFCIDCPKDQMMFKDMLQIRFIEELTEATVDFKNYEHLKEELTDALNFFLSAYIMLGVDFNKFPDPSTILMKLPPNSESELGRFFDIPDMWSETYRVIERVGYLCNLLKNRPWAQSNYLVSMLDFNERLTDLWVTFWHYLYAWGIGKETLFDMFERKLLVNGFRVETGY